MPASERDLMMNISSMSVNREKIAAHSYLHPVDLVEFAPETTINDEVVFGVVELNLELVMP